MNRREAIKGLAALGMLSFLPKVWQIQNNSEIPLHIIGLGGAGCNALEFMRKQGVRAKYTCISSPVRQHLPADIKFIKFDSPRVIYSNKSSMKMHLTDDINALFNPHNKYILLTGLGGYTGTNLLRTIMDKLILEQIEFNSLCCLPFNFEGVFRKNTAAQIVSDYHSLENFWYFDLEILKKDMSLKIVSDAFKKADERFYQIFINHLA